MTLDLAAMSSLMDEAIAVVKRAKNYEDGESGLRTLAQEKVNTREYAFLLVTEFRNAACGRANQAALGRVRPRDSLASMQDVLVETLVKSLAPYLKQIPNK